MAGAVPIEDTPDNQPSTSQLRRVIRLPHATAMVVGTIIGASVFVQPAEVTGQVPSVGGVLLVWLVAGVLTMFGALIVAELASIFTQSGGVYVYLKEAFSPSLGFLWGWAMFWTMHSGIIAVVATIIARYVGYFFPSLGDEGKSGVAIGAIVILSAVNYVGVKHGSVLQTLFTLGKLIAVVVIIVAGFALGSRVPEHFVVSESFATGVGVKEFGLALVAGLFTYGGWHMVAYNSEETVNPKRTIPLALILGSVTVTLCYILLNTVYMYVLPLEELAASERVAADAADAVLGSGGGAMMSGLVIFSSFGALSGIILSGPRVYYAMARDGLLFRWMGAVHPRFQTPHRAILAQAVWSSFLVATGTYSVLFARVVYTEWIFFALMAASVFVFRRRPDIKRGYGVWGYPVVPVVFIVASLAIVANHVISDVASSLAGELAADGTPKRFDSLKGLGLVLVGLPVYYLWIWVKSTMGGKAAS